MANYFDLLLLSSLSWKPILCEMRSRPSRLWIIVVVCVHRWENDDHKLVKNWTAPNRKWHVYFWCNWDAFPEVCNPQTFVRWLVCFFLSNLFLNRFFNSRFYHIFSLDTCRCWVELDLRCFVQFVCVFYFSSFIPLKVWQVSLESFKYSGK